MGKSKAGLASDESGAVAILFALTLFVMLGCAGLAVDYSRGTSSRASMQQDLDATMIYLATERLRQGDDLDLTSAANTYMDGLRRQRAISGEVSVVVTAIDEYTIKGTASGVVKSRLMQMLGVNALNVVVDSEVASGSSPMEIAMVVDTTTSMSGAKLDELKTAAKSLVEKTLSVAKNPGDTKISLVPFALHVNVGLSRRNESWIDVAPDKTSTSQDLCPSRPNATMVPGTCVPMSGSYTHDGVTYPTTWTQCDFVEGAETFQCGASDKIEWRGCVGSRDYPLDTLDAQYSTTRVPGPSDIWCPSELTPLTDDQSELDDAIDALWADGNTYIPTGLMWGWRTLSNTAPFSEGVANGTKVNGQPVRKILVLMTDGENSASPSYAYEAGNPHHWGSDIDKANALTAEACANIKADGVEIYTVAFDVSDETIKGILDTCASKPSNFYDADSSGELIKSFETIAENLAALRIMK